MPILAAGNNASRHRGEGGTPLRRSAEHDFTPRRRSAEHGFTLVELMIVIALIGLVSAAVVLSLPDPRGRLRDDAERFAARVRAAHDLAIVEGRSVSVWVSDGGYGFDQRAAGAWTPVSEKPFQVTRWGDGIRPQITAPSGRDRVIFDSTGLGSTPMTIRLQRGRDATTTVKIGIDGAVAIDG
ncbi:MULTISPECIES: GspH/FimT family pseudopilin [Sphingomonas]|uniref:GspH/FimT family pseudopilin n=1 Tax=Sphingomonas TaxID=13687 RepID=UPI001E2BECDD|nr:GspH/FimT family pseudopilin [Sphingomonas sp. CCH10-B3]